ncbi:hypothetical protein OAA15_00020 [bacterium]|nr:hypothetical protein [bacterium]
MNQEKIKILKKVYNNQTYKNVIDTEFSQLIQPVTSIEEDQITVSEFFKLYEELFFDIDKLGDKESHKFLINQSIQYLGDEYTNPLIDELQREITALKEQILNSSTTINDLSGQLKDIGSAINDVNNG